MKKLIFAVIMVLAFIAGDAFLQDSARQIFALFALWSIYVFAAFATYWIIDKTHFLITGKRWITFHGSRSLPKP